MATTYAAFISHASQDRRAAERLESALGRARVWFDRSDVRLGTLLGRELLSNIRRSRTLVLLWSKAAQHSPWVQTEWISAVSLGKAVIPIALDRTPLPQALGNTLRQSLRQAPKAAIVELRRAVKTRRQARRSVTPAMRLPDAERDAAIGRLAREQAALFDTWNDGGISAARKVQRRLERATASLLAQYPLDSNVAALWAYHAKNGVLLDHHAEIGAGIRVTDQRLDQARWRFLHALWLDPFNPDALNGLGTIAWFDHDLDTAEFFVRAALRQEPHYADAQHDLAMILQLRRHARSGHKQAWLDVLA